MDVSIAADASISSRRELLASTILAARDWTSGLRSGGDAERSRGNKASCTNRAGSQSGVRSGVGVTSGADFAWRGRVGGLKLSKVVAASAESSRVGDGAAVAGRVVRAETETAVDTSARGRRHAGKGILSGISVQLTDGCVARSAS